MIHTRARANGPGFLFIYNPVKAGEHLMITTKEEGAYSLFSAGGQPISKGKLTGKLGIDTSSLPTGVYIIKVETQSTITSYKIIVK
ncbi:T9SS type A sorting domain-containing protein [Chryseobacterium indologenes]|nr:T9SS type A sorting domain-containing protein [Chryseobacterium indologenes]